MNSAGRFSENAFMPSFWSPARLPYAKAVGIQPRTLELLDRMGLVREVLDAAVAMRSA
ncbi:hypothetical protein SMICM304S_02724 [Streptomyces microflavus]